MSASAKRGGRAAKVGRQKAGSRTQNGHPLQKLSAFHPQKRNINLGRPHGLAALDKSLRRDGYSAPMVAAADGEVFAGSKRLERVADIMPDAAPIIVHSDGTRPVIHVRDDIPNADDPRAVRLGYADNAIAAADWNPDGELLAALVQSDPAIAELARQENASLKALAAYAAEQEIADAEPQTDRAEELNRKWKVKRGDLWRIGEHRLLCGDSTVRADVERVMDGDKAGACVTDPPYGMDLDTDWSDAIGSIGSIGYKNNTHGNRYPKVEGDDKPFDPVPIFEFWKAHEMFLFGADYYADKIPSRLDGSWLVWDKRKESQSEAIGAEFELIWSRVKHKRRVLRFDWFGFLSSSAPREARDRVHPTQKPTPLIQFIIREWCKDDIISDPYCGSGTTLIACQNLQRRCHAIEISPTYCAVTLQRMADAFPGIEIERL